MNYIHYTPKHRPAIIVKKGTLKRTAKNSKEFQEMRTELRENSYKREDGTIVVRIKEEISD